MHRDVAVQEPRARVVGFECDDDESARGEEYDVAAGRVVEFRGEVRVVERGGGLLEQREVVAVEMDLKKKKKSVGG